MKHILAAIDGSDPSFRALEFAVGLAAQTGTRITVLIVREYLVGRKDVYPALNQEEFRSVKERAQKIIDTANIGENEIMSPKSRDAAYTIVDVAIEEGADLIVMGASGKGSVKSMLLGSVSKEVLRKAVCPVTIVH